MKILQFTRGDSHPFPREIVVIEDDTTETRDELLSGDDAPLAYGGGWELVREIEITAPDLDLLPLDTPLVDWMAAP